MNRAHGSTEETQYYRELFFLSLTARSPQRLNGLRRWGNATIESCKVFRRSLIKKCLNDIMALYLLRKTHGQEYH